MKRATGCKRCPRLESIEALSDRFGVPQTTAGSYLGEHGYYDRNTYRPIEPSKVLQEDTNKVLICVEVKARWIQGAAVLEKQSVLASNKL